MTPNDNAKIGGLLLAAGGSARFGSPKQLARLEGKTLLRRAAEALVNSQCDPVVVVLGAEIEGSQTEIADLSLTICINKDWQSGMSGSIIAGLIAVLRIEPDLTAVMITLCDQPYVTTAKIDLFAAKFRAEPTDVIAAEYDGVKGVPALFARPMFDQLLKLHGDTGARDLIRNREGDPTINMTEAAFDIDVLDDLESAILPGGN